MENLFNKYLRPKHYRLNVKEFIFALLFNRFVGIEKKNMLIRNAFHSFEQTTSAYRL